MAGTELGQLQYTLTLTDDGFTDKLDTAKNQVKSASDGMSASLDSTAESSSKLRGAFSSLATQFALGQAIFTVAQKAISSIKGVLTDGIQASKDWQTAQAQMQAGLKSTSDASGMTSKSLIELAENMEKSTPISKEATLTGENMLLTFTGIGKQVFPQATQAVADMATRMSGGAVPTMQMMNSTALQLGKALNDPETGLTKLQRMGVVFTQQQKDQIKTLQDSGHTMQAQQVILDELGKEFGGSATASMKTWQGWVDSTKNKLNDLTGEGISKLKDMLTNLANTLASFVASKGFQDMLKGIETAFLAIWHAISENLLPALAKLWKAINPALIDALKLIGEIMGVTIVIAFKLTIISIEVLIDVLGWLANIIVDVIHWFEQHRVALVSLIAVMSVVAATILVIVVPALISAVIGFGSMAIAGVAAAISVAAAWIVAALPFIAIIAVIAAVAAAAYEVVSHWSDVKQWFDDFTNWFKAHWQIILVTIMPIMIIPLEIISHWSDLKQWFMDFIHDVGGFFSRGFHDIAQWVNDAWHGIVGIWQAAIGFYEGIINAVVNAFINGANFIKNIFVGVWNDLVRGIQATANDVIGVFQAIVRFIDGVAREFDNLLYQAGKDLISGLIKGIKDSVGDVVNAVKNVGKTVVNAAKDVLKIFSPSQVFADIGSNVTLGLAQGISSTSHQAIQATQGVAQAVVGAGSTLPTSIANNTNTNNSSNSVQYNFGQGSIVLSTREATDEFFSIGNRNTLLESMGVAPLAGTTGV